MKKVVLPLIIAGSFLGGCATIVGDRSQLIPISSSPSDASVLITDEKGVEIFKGKTPTTVTLQKSDGGYWGGKNFVVKITKDGYEEQSIPITSSPNGWYLGGNLILGGVIGWFIVDPLNGAMYTLSPEQVSATMAEKTRHNNHARDGSISIVLLEDVPSSLRSKMARLPRLK
jgi:hypothetical protein